MKTIIIFSFMIKDLKLKGAELLLYALIYSFSQFGLCCFMKPERISKELGLSRSQVFRALSSLITKGYITSSGKAYICMTHDLVDSSVEFDLAEAIRIAKTPWLD